MIKLPVTPSEYQSAHPFPHCVIHNVLPLELAKSLQDEILDLPKTYFDRYSNPFEQKSTLRDKTNLPPKCTSLFQYLTSKDWLSKLSELVGYELLNDPTRNFWGIHTFQNGDKLDIHCDAGQHPLTGQKKQITLGLYLSKNWDTSYGGNLELWSGDCSSLDTATLKACEVKVPCKFNTMVIFTCSDNSWHGAPEPVKCPDNATRIFLTLSYLSNNTNYLNHRPKAFFRKRPQDPDDQEVEKLRLMRADPDLYKHVYRTN